ncbi:hypothetical protein BDR04DRAFT_1095167 [Suillus decipiens]|nr:hypothetical protein BDR04DRAFT_1095167 [Suillus decipiens]
MVTLGKTVHQTNLGSLEMELQNTDPHLLPLSQSSHSTSPDPMRHKTTAQLKINGTAYMPRRSLSLTA